MNRRAFLKAGGGATFLLMSPSLFSAADEKGSGPSREELIAAAKSRIQQHRKGACSVRVEDPGGRAVPGAKVKIEQLRHEFLFGCNLFMFGRCGDPEAEQEYRRRFSALLNYATLGFYWANYEAQEGHPNYAYTDQVLAWTKENGIVCKGHPLVWDHPASSPRWLPDDKAEIERSSKSRVREIVSRFRGRLDMWDVVNEAVHLPDKVNKTKMAQWALEKGPLPYVVENLEIAREANPSAFLLVNDYRIEPKYFRLLKDIQTKGKNLYDAVGLQTHMHDGPWSTGRLKEVCDSYAELGLPLHFTETTLVSGPRLGPGQNWGETTADGEAKQALDAELFYVTLFAHPAVGAITWWDFSDRGAWQRAAAGWLRKDMSPKPVYERLFALIKAEWWTKTDGVTGGDGQFTLRAFYGTHRISIELPGGRQISKEVRWLRGKDNQLVITT